MTRAQFSMIFLVALAVRLIHFVWLQHDGTTFLTEDAEYYWGLGEAIVAHGGDYMHSAASDTFPESERMPLYPYLLAAVMALGGGLGAALCVNAILDSITCVVIAALAARWSMRSGIAAGIIAALSPSLIIHASMILTETIFLLPLSLALLGCVAYLADPSPRPASWTGLALGVATLARAVTLPMVFVLAAVAPVIALVRKRSLKIAAMSSCAIAVFAMLVISPVSIRNTIVFGSPALNSQSGAHLTLWVLPLLLQQETGRPFSEITPEINREIDAAIAKSGQDPDEMDLMVRSRILETVGWSMLKDISLKTWILSIGKTSIVNLGAPMMVLHPSIRKLSNASFYNTPGSGLVDRATRFLSHADPRFTSALIISGVGSIVMSILSLAGLIVLFRSQPWAAVFAILYILYFSLLNGPVLSPKYRLPMEPVLIALAAVAIDSLLSRASKIRHIKNVNKK